MSSSKFRIDPEAVLVADASVVINLNATACASEIIRALPNRFVVTDNAFAELEDGTRNGHDDAQQLWALIDAGLAQLVRPGPAGSTVYESLVTGSTLRTLDDGEAATISYAQETAGIALIDERKARSLCAGRFPGLRVASTVDLLIHETVALALGPQGQIDALVNALTRARMRVPTEQLTIVKKLIGAERAASCMSLPKVARAT